MLYNKNKNVKITQLPNNLLTVLCDGGTLRLRTLIHFIILENRYILQFSTYDFG